MKKILITGAAGNLGGLLADHIKDSDILLNLMIHKKDVKSELYKYPNVKVIRADLSKMETLDKVLNSVDVVVHFAGILFKANPEKFLPETNTQYFQHLVEKSLEHKVNRIILISFPHVEGETTPDNPAMGSLDKRPISMHAITRLEEEKFLFEMGKRYGFEAVSLRLGMVYGKGILMIEAARWFAKYHLLGIWRKPTYIHLISISDYLEATKRAILNEGIRGIYHIGDDGKQTLQEFLHDATKVWGFKKPWKMPVGMIMFAARLFEWYSLIFNTRSPLTRDFVKIGMVSYYGDTKRMKLDLLPKLKYRTYQEGLETLK